MESDGLVGGTVTSGPKAKGPTKAIGPRKPFRFDEISYWTASASPKPRGLVAVETLVVPVLLPIGSSFGWRLDPRKRRTIRIEPEPAPTEFPHGLSRHPIKDINQHLLFRVTGKSAREDLNE